MPESKQSSGWLTGRSSIDTIYALSTAPGRAGVAVIRASGPQADACLAQLIRGTLPSPRRAALRELVHPETGQLIDKALLLRFSAGASFTGESTIEFHVHGGRAVVAAVLDCLAGFQGMRAAKPGEFTRRAFDNGELDLAQVEGLADLISAETELQRRQAMEIMAGALSGLAEGWRADLIYALAMTEATIDWADEEVPEDVSPEVLSRLNAVRSQMMRELEGAAAAKSLREGYEVAIVGAPNVGKSSLINAISRREAAIISSVPGTTRDVIEVRCDLFGVPVTFLDTAGLRETEDEIETIGVGRALTRAKGADLRVLVNAPDGSPVDQWLDDAVDLRFWNKADMQTPPPPGIWICGSAKTGQGIDALLRAISDLVRTRTGRSSLAAHDRVASCLRRGVQLLESASAGLEADAHSELVSEDIRQAIRSVEEIVGRVETDDMLDVVFNQFCLGK